MCYFTVFTPVYNGRHVIHRVWDSLRAQTFQDFEWLIVDDGSDDGVVDLLYEYRKCANFPLRIFSQSNKGKHVAWNRAVRLASGDLFVPADMDDTFVPIALERLKLIWESIPPDKRKGFSGVNVLCLDPVTGNIIGDRYPRDRLVTNNLELDYVYKVSGEKWGCIRTDILRDNPFMEVPGYVPESFVWFTIARKYHVICVNECLRFWYLDRGRNNLSSKRPFMILSEGQYRYLCWHLSENLDYLWKSKKDLLRTARNIWPVGLHSGRGLGAILEDINNGKSKLLACIVLPVGLVMFMRDFLLYRKLFFKLS